MVKNKYLRRSLKVTRTIPSDKARTAFLSSSSSSSSVQYCSTVMVVYVGERLPVLQGTLGGRHHRRCRRHHRFPDSALAPTLWGRRQEARTIASWLISLLQLLLYFTIYWGFSTIFFYVDTHSHTRHALTTDTADTELLLCWCTALKRGLDRAQFPSPPRGGNWLCLSPSHWAGAQAHVFIFLG